MQLTGTLTEFLLTLVLGSILLMICAFIATGVKRIDGGWEIKPAHKVFSFAFFIFASLVIGLALYDKFWTARTAMFPIEVNHLLLNWGSTMATNSNSQLVTLAPPKAVGTGDPAHQAWEWRAVSQFREDFSRKPDIFISLTEFDQKLAGKRYWLTATALGGNQYEVRLTVWDLTDTGIPGLQFEVDTAACGIGREYRQRFC